MLRQLFWKDVRICRIAIVASIAMIIGAYLLAYLIISEDVWLRFGTEPRLLWALRLLLGGSLAVAALQVALAIAAGSLISTERADGTAEFLGALPLSKIQILGSKLLVLVLFIAVTAIFSWGGIWFSPMFAVLPPHGEIAQIGFDLRPMVAFGAAAIGTGWCASALLRSTGWSVGLALALPLIMVLTLALFNDRFQVLGNAEFQVVFYTLSWLMGIGLFITGTVCFLRSVEY